MDEDCIHPVDWIPTVDDLEQILRGHIDWIGAEGWLNAATPGRAVLCNANLFGADLSNRDLGWADLSNAQLSSSNFSGARLDSADLSRAFLERANLTNAYLENTDFSDAILERANFTRATILNSDFSFAEMANTIFASAEIDGSIFYGSALWGADFNRASVYEADFSTADLVQADFTDAILDRADISGARLDHISLLRTIYQPIGSPDPNYLHSIQDLDTVKFDDSRGAALVGLRNQLQQVGQRELERAATYAIEHNRNQHASWLRSVLYTVAFQWPAAFGLDAYRPLYIIIVIIFIMAVPYTVVVRHPSTVSPEFGGTAVFKVYPKGFIVRTENGYLIEEDNRIDVVRESDYGRAIALGLYVSILSTFRLGFREVNIGVWISRIQRKEYELRVTGVARTLSGIQAVFSLYMIVSWFIFLFLRPLH